MDEKALKAQLDELKANLEKAINEKNEKEIKSIQEQIKALEPLGKEFPDFKKEFTEWKVKKDEADKKNQEALDTLIAQQKEFFDKVPKNKGENFGDVLGNELEKNKTQLSEFKDGRKAVSLNLKVVGNMGSGNFTTTGTQRFLDPQMVGAVGRKPYEAQHIRDIVGGIVPVSDTTDIFVIRDAAGEGGPTTVAPAAAKPQSDRDYVKLIVPITKIATYFKIPEEYLEDISWLQSEISAVGVEELLAKEDDLFLTNAGAGEFAGLTTTTNSTAYATPASLALAIEAANNYDVLVAAWTQLRILKNSANLVLVNPADFARMVLTKATTGEYVFGAPNVNVPNVFGVPLLPHTAIASDKFLLGDFSKVRVAQRKAIQVRFYDQNEDDAIKNMVTVVIEERVAIVADRNDRLIYGDFSDARAALETA